MRRQTKDMEVSTAQQRRNPFNGDIRITPCCRYLMFAMINAIEEQAQEPAAIISYLGIVPLPEESRGTRMAVGFVRAGRHVRTSNDMSVGPVTTNPALNQDDIPVDFIASRT